MQRPALTILRIQEGFHPNGQSDMSDPNKIRYILINRWSAKNITSEVRNLTIYRARLKFIFLTKTRNNRKDQNDRKLS